MRFTVGPPDPDAVQGHELEGLSGGEPRPRTQRRAQRVGEERLHRLRHHRPELSRTPHLLLLFERLVAFSCKARVCPSCNARRMEDTAQHLVRNVSA
jgi:hypothetical protein